MLVTAVCLFFLSIYQSIKDNNNNNNNNNKGLGLGLGFKPVAKEDWETGTYNRNWDAPKKQHVST